MLHVYGIPNCQTVKKARLWLDEQQIPYTFHNFKTEVPTASLLQQWLQVLPLEQLVNKRGTTWRKLSPEEQHDLTQNDTAIDVLMANSSVIKRPVLVLSNEHMILGFDEEKYADALKQS